jgi:hypothetical protein
VELENPRDINPLTTFFCFVWEEHVQFPQEYLSSLCFETVRKFHIPVPTTSKPIQFQKRQEIHGREMGCSSGQKICVQRGERDVVVVARGEWKIDTPHP